jgi:DNA-binding transcriptional LysR family regulator
MELRQLKYFVIVAEELSFTKAAERLYLVQPALTRQIALLEKKIGAPLFNRSKRQILLTEVGKVLLEEARAAIERTDHAFARTQRFARGESGRLRVGFTAAALYGILPQFKMILSKNHPEVDLEVVELCSFDQETALVTHEIHLGLLHPPVYDQRIKHETLWHDPLVLAVRTGHPLATQSSVGFEQLKGESLILLPRDQGPFLHDRIVGFCSDAGFAPEIVSREMRTPNVLSLVAAGLGLGFLPRTVCRQPYLGVQFVPLQVSNLGLDLAIAWRRGIEIPFLEPVLTLLRNSSTQPS